MADGKPGQTLWKSDNKLVKQGLYYLYLKL